MIFSVNGRRQIGFSQLNLGLMICATVTSFVVDCKIATIEMQLAPSQREQTEKRKPTDLVGSHTPYIGNVTLNNTTIQVTPEGLEPSTCALRVRCSAKLSYGAMQPNYTNWP